jgi:hypothetical protein
VLDVNAKKEEWGRRRGKTRGAVLRGGERGWRWLCGEGLEDSSEREVALKGLKNEPMATQVVLISAEVLWRWNAAQAATP